MPTHFDITSIARRLDAGTYVPRQRTIEIPSVNSRPMRDYAAEILASAALGGFIGFMIGGM